MNELVQVDSARTAPLVASGNRPVSIVPTDMDQVWRFATIVAKSGMAPKGMEKPEAICVAIMHGLEVGLKPLMALQRIAVINGRPSIWGDGAIGLVRASGLCEYVSEVLTGDGELMVAVCRTKRKGEKDIIERSYSVADAKKAGLWGKAGPWQTSPKRMLQMRARGFALRDGFADVLGGLYIAEELDDLDTEERQNRARDVSPRRPAIEQQPHASEADAPEQPQTGRKALPPVARPTPSTVEPVNDPLEIPAALDRRKKAAPSPEDNPIAWLEWVEATLGAIKEPDALADIWVTMIDPTYQQAAPGDQEEANGLYRKHEERLAA